MLETYIGTKIIQGEPQTCQKDDHNSKVGDPGYKVVYEGGYTSWSPKDVFEKAYRKTDGMTFWLAIEAMKKGLKVCLPHWGDNVSLAMTVSGKDEELEFTILEGRIGSEEFKFGPWEVNQVDILSDKWKIWEKK